MGLIDYARIARRRWTLIASVVLVVTLGAIFYASSSVATYTATSRLYISMATGTSVADAYQGNLASQQRVTSYVNLVSSETVAANVIRDLNLDLTTAQLQSMISASFTPGTVLIQIAVTDSTPESAQTINTGVVRAFEQLVAQLETTVVGAAAAAKLTVVDPAQTPVAEGGGGAIGKTGLLGLIAGLGLGCAAAYVRDRLDGTVRNAEQLAEATALPLLGSFTGKNSHDEARRLAVRLKFTDDQMETRSIVTTSVTRKSTRSIALDLATAFADTGSTVAVIDADLRGVGISTDVGSTSVTGLADLLRSPSDLALPNLIHTDDAAIGVLPIGHVDDATGDLLASQRLTEIIAELRTTHDYVIMDCPTRAGSSDSLPMAALCDGVVIAVEMAATTGKTLRTTIESFAQVGSTVIGTVALPKTSRSLSRPARQQPTTTTTKAMATPTPVPPFAPTPPPAPTPTPLPVAVIEEDPAEIAAPVHHSQVDAAPHRGYEQPLRAYEEPEPAYESRPRRYEEPEEPAPRTYYSQGQSAPPRENYRARRDFTPSSDRSSNTEYPPADRPTMTPPPERTIQQPLRPPRERYPASDFPTIEVRRAVTPTESGRAFSNVPGLDKWSNGPKSNGVDPTDDAQEVQPEDAATGAVPLPVDVARTEGKRDRIDTDQDVVTLDDAAQKGDNTDKEPNTSAAKASDADGETVDDTANRDNVKVDDTEIEDTEIEDAGDVEAEAPTVHLRKITTEDVASRAGAGVSSSSAGRGKSGNGSSWRKQYSRDKE